MTEASPPRSGSAGVKWNALGLVGRQSVLLVFSLVLARILGPDSYAIVAQAQIYITLTTMILDQGLAAALIQRRELSRDIVGATMTINLILAIGLAALTVPFSPLAAAFFATPELAAVLVILGAGLVAKAMGIVPRALLVRSLDFRSTAIADSIAPIVGGLVGLSAALLGTGYWALVIQIIVTDVVASTILIIRGGIPRPSLRLGSLRDSIGYSTRIFGANVVSFVSRNADNILVGRYLGQASLSFYSLAYRVLLLPTQMVSQTVIQVLFPSLAKSQESPGAVTSATLRSIRGLAAITFPLMAFIAVSANETVSIILGASWMPLVPLIAILAFTGARQSVTAVNAPVYMAAGRADVHFRFSVLAAVVQVGGIVAGLPFGVVGVAWGYTIAGVMLTPLMSFLLKRYSALGYRLQGSALWPALHGSVWLILTYWAVSLVVTSGWWRLVLGSLAGIGAYGLIVLVLHRRYGRALLTDLRTISRRARPEV